MNIDKDEIVIRWHDPDKPADDMIYIVPKSRKNKLKPSKSILDISNIKTLQEKIKNEQ